MTQQQEELKQVHDALNKPLVNMANGVRCFDSKTIDRNLKRLQQLITNNGNEPK